jgi:hypothetical protein
MRIKKLALIYYKSRNFSNFLQHRQAILAKKEKEKEKATASKQEKKHNCSLIKHNLTKEIKVVSDRHFKAISKRK